MQGRSSSICSQERDAGAALQQGGRQPRHLDERTGARGGFGRGARSGGAEPRGDNRLQPTPTWEQPPSIESVYLSTNSMYGISYQRRRESAAHLAEFFGWSRPLQKSPPSAGAALEAGSASEPLGTPVVDVPTQPPFLLGTAMDLHGDAETLRVSVPMQTPGPAPALAPSPGEEKEKITAMPVAGRRSSGAVGVSASATAAGVAELSGAASAAGGGGSSLCVMSRVRAALPPGGLCPLGATQLTVTAAPVARLLGARSRQGSRRHGVALGCCRCSLRRSLPCQCRWRRSERHWRRMLLER